MDRNLFITLDGEVIDDGSSSACVCFPVVAGRRFAPIGRLHGRHIFGEMTAEQSAAFETSPPVGMGVGK